MTNHAKLIAEAEARRDAPDHDGSMCSLLDRLAAALRECAVPDGWTATEYTRDDGAMCLATGSQKDLIAGLLMWTSFTTENKFMGDFPTASAAMAALDGEGK